MGFGPKQGKGGAAMARVLTKARTKKKPSTPRARFAGELTGIAVALQAVLSENCMDANDYDRVEAVYDRIESLLAEVEDV